MSGATDAVVVLPVAAVAGLIVGGVVVGVGAAAFAAANQLEREYREALTAFHTRAEEERQQRFDVFQKDQASTAAALSLAAATTVESGGDADATFLLRSLDILEHRALSQSRADLVERCHRLKSGVSDRPGDLVAHMADYHCISEAISQIPLPKASAATVHTLDVYMDELAAELDTPVMASAGAEKIRSTLAGQLESLKALAISQPEMARQGLGLLRQRIHRAVEEQVLRRAERLHRAGEIRDAVGSACAKIVALSGQDGLPDHQARAQRYSARLSAAIAADDMASLQHVTAEIDALFAEAQKTLDEAATAAYLESQVVDVLLSLGYRVSHVADTESRSVVMALDAAHGVEVRMDGKGQLRSEMVAFDERNAELDPAKQEKVCSLMDNVFQALRDRECTVRERTRRSFKRAQRLRAVARPTTEQAPSQSATAPRSLQAGD